MLLSYNWLKKYLPSLDQVDLKKLADQVSKSLAEVESISVIGGELSNIVAGEIKSIDPHPTNTKALIAKVDTGDKVRQIVFSKNNEALITVGKKYPICLPEGRIYKKNNKGSEIEYTDVRIIEIDNQISEGSICGVDELGLPSDVRINEFLEDNIKVGQDLTPILKDQVFEIENKSLTHRPDCFSHRGIAREISAIMNIDYVEDQKPAIAVKSGDLELKVEVEDKTNCTRFSGAIMSNVKVGISPSWMQLLLIRTGMRPINNIVDISNYILLDIGNPTHIYDYDKISGKRLTVRKAKDGEKFKALNTKTYELKNDMVVVADADGAEDLAGIMGGSKSEISKSTKNIVIEAANFNMYNIRRTSMQLGLTSEASVRFSKGLDPEQTVDTVNYTVTLLEDLAQGEMASELIDIKNYEYTPKVIVFNPRMIKRLIGIEIEKDDLLAIIKSLGINVKNIDELPAQLNGDMEIEMELEIPTFRKDLNIPQDLIEEIARIYGYENVKPQMPTRSIESANQNIDSTLPRVIRRALTTSNLDEIYTYAFVSKSLFEKSDLKLDQSIKILNAVSPELQYMRSEILPGHLDKIESNLSNFDKFGYFEISRVASREINKQEQIPMQPIRIAGVQVDSKNNPNLFFELKSKLAYLFENLQIEVKYENIDGKIKENIENIFHPNQTARIIAVKNNSVIGHIGAINPKVLHNFELNRTSVAGFNLDYETIKNIYISTNHDNYIPVINIPKVSRDINIWVEDRTEIGKVIDTLLGQEHKNLESIKIVDIFVKDSAKKSITLRFTLSDKSKTLTDEEVNTSMDQIKEAISKEGLTIRD